MGGAGEKILVVQAAALGHDLVRTHAAAFGELGLAFHPLRPVFPAVTCTAQASFRTASPPAAHGMVANGCFDRALRRAFFWEQSAHLVAGARIWEQRRAAGGTAGLICWQQSLGEAADLILSPAPIHKHHGGMIQDCYSRPAGLYAELCATVGAKFNLRHYWGPMASVRASEWIAAATAAVLRSPQAPDLLLTYLPHLDYALLKHGPQGGAPVVKAVREAVSLLRGLKDAAAAAGRRFLVWGDYAITQANQVVYPNRALAAAGLFSPRRVGGRLYPDLFSSRAFAMVDHQVAHVFIHDPKDIDAVRACLAGLPGVDALLPHAALPHPHSGELVAVAAPDAWFAYPWWDDPATAPDYAGHVDIHSKPGFDPAELFWGWPPPRTSTDAGRVGGSHGRADQAAAFATDLELPGQPADLLELAAALRLLNGSSHG